MDRILILQRCRRFLGDCGRAVSTFADALSWQEKIARLHDEKQIARHRQSLRWTLPFCWLALLGLSFLLGCRTSEILLPRSQQISSLRLSEMDNARDLQERVAATLAEELREAFKSPLAAGDKEAKTAPLKKELCVTPGRLY